LKQIRASLFSQKDLKVPDFDKKLNLDQRKDVISSEEAFSIEMKI